MLSIVALVACQAKGPAPTSGALPEREEVIIAQAEQTASPDNPHLRGMPMNPHAQGAQSGALGRANQVNPHGSGTEVPPPDSHVSGTVDLVDVGGLHFKAPEGWEYEHPTSRMRRAQFAVPGEQGTAGLVVYFFGNQGAGSSQANIDRWVGQFKDPDGSAISVPKPAKRKIAGFQTTQVEAAGTYVGGMGAGSPQAAQGQPGQRMIATIVETPSGPFYFKFLGADKTVAENRKALEGLLASMKFSP